MRCLVQLSDRYCWLTILLLSFALSARLVRFFLVVGQCTPHLPKLFANLTKGQIRIIGLNLFTVFLRKEHEPSQWLFPGTTLGLLQQKMWRGTERNSGKWPLKNSSSYRSLTLQKSNDPHTTRTFLGLYSASFLAMLLPGVGAVDAQSECMVLYCRDYATVALLCDRCTRHSVVSTDTGRLCVQWKARQKQRSIQC